jgi:hypothetical protein
MALSHLEGAGYPPVSLRLGGEWRQRVHLALIVWWRGPSLDRQLAAGANPRASAALALRARRITAPRSRARLADGLMRAIRAAQTPPGLSAAMRPHREEVLAVRTVLATLERRLRAPEPASARGVALLQTLLTDGASPLYRPDERGALGSELRAAAAALESHPGQEELA